MKPEELLQRVAEKKAPSPTPLWPVPEPAVSHHSPGIKTLTRRGFHGVHASCRPVGTYNSLPAGPGYHQTPLKSVTAPWPAGYLCIKAGLP